MKISKSLIQAILVGVTVSATASCELIEPITKKDKHECTVQCDENGTCTVGEDFDCPACGMG